jgi:signal transduction histidine kinase
MRNIGMKVKCFLYLLAAIAICTFTLGACSEGNETIELKANEADSLIFKIGITKDYKRMRTVTDSLEKSGDISPLVAYRWLGVSYYREHNYHMAEICYRKALECQVKTEQDQLSYTKSVRRLSELLLVKGDFEGCLRIAIPAVQKMEETGIGSDIDYAILLNNIGCCQLNLGQDQEAQESFYTARGHYINRWTTDSSARGFQEAVIGTVYTSEAYINTRRYAESIYWIDRTEMLLDKYRLKPDARTEYFDEYQGRIEVMRAVARQGLGEVEEAEKAYQAFLKTDYSKTSAGRINATEYLFAAGRYQEAADNYRFLDETLDEWDMEPTLNNIQLYLLPKYRANSLAGREDSARFSARRILLILDSAITAEKNSSMAELATIYDTNQKDAQIVQQQADMARMRWLSTTAALVLLTVFFVIYTLYRRKAQKRLAAANEKLEESNVKLEETNDKLEKSNEKLEEYNQRLEAGNAKLSALNTQLVAANERAEESSKMKTNFIQQISHEIRTPLNILSGFTQIITTPGMELDDETRNDINRQINENTGRITGLVNKMLELSDASSQSDIERKDNVLAIQIAAQAAEESHINDAKHLTFDIQISPEAETTMLRTNEQQATRALVLILDNAIKFTRPAEAALATTQSNDVKTVVLRLALDDGRLRFEVEDTGIGVPPEEAEHIFDEFVQLDDYYDGTGIGLTVARSIARRLGGDIVLDTSYSTGARFVMTLPTVTTGETAQM